MRTAQQCYQTLLTSRSLQYDFWKRTERLSLTTPNLLQRQRQPAASRDALPLLPQCVCVNSKLFVQLRRRRRSNDCWGNATNQRCLENRSQVRERSCLLEQQRRQRLSGPIITKRMQQIKGASVLPHNLIDAGSRSHSCDVIGLGWRMPFFYQKKCVVRMSWQFEIYNSITTVFIVRSWECPVKVLRKSIQQEWSECQESVFRQKCQERVSSEKIKKECQKEFSKCQALLKKATCALTTL